MINNLKIPFRWVTALPIISCALAGQVQAQKLEEVVVTATKRVQNLQDVPASITAMTAEEMRQRVILETSDLMGTAPNLQVTSAYSTTQPNFSIRGISVANEFSAATASPIGVYVDEVYQTFRGSHGQQLFDLDRVEVIRGPQGTLFGRNTTGGAVSLFTRKPGLDGTSGFIEGGIGNHEMYNATGAIETSTANNNFGIRLAGTVRKADGYTKNPIDGKDYGEIDSEAFRLSAVWTPTDTLSAHFKIYTAENDVLGDLPYGSGYGPNQTNVLGFATRLSLGSGRLLDEDEVESNSGNGYYTSTDGFSMTWEWQRGDWTFTSITGYDENDYQLNPFDCDGTILDICAIRYDSESESFNQDLRATFSNEKLFFVGGIYFGTEEVETHNEPDFFGLLDDQLPASLFNPVVGEIAPSNPALGVLPADGQCNPLAINPNGFIDTRTFFEFLGLTSGCMEAGAPSFTSILADQRFTIDRPSQAIYGELSYDFTDALTVTVGLRFTQDEVKLEDARTVLFSEDGAARATTIPYSFPANLDLPLVEDDEDSDEVTGCLIVDYRFNDGTMAYASYSHGYRAGTFNALAYQDINQVYYVESEIVDAYEVGFKGRFFDQRLQVNGAAFFYDYENQQIAEIVGTTSFLRSANGELTGLEIEVIALPTDDLELRASIGLLDSEYDDNQRFTEEGMDIGGNDFPNAPDETFIAGLNWDLWSGGQASVKLSAEARYMGEYMFDPFGNYLGNYPGGPNDQGGGYAATAELAEGNSDYWVYDARLTWEAPKYSVSLWGKNLSDEFYYVYGLNLNAFGQDYFTRGLPRTYGLEARYNF